MILKYFCIVIIVFFSLKTQSQNCDCRENLKSLIKKIEDNYAGFANKVNKKRKGDYNNLCLSLLDSAKEKKGIACFQILDKYISWFKDFHLTVSVSMLQQNAEEIRTFFSNAPKYIEDTIQTSLQRKIRKDPIEGVWEMRSRNTYYKVLIKREKGNKFIGVVINADSVYWVPGQIKLLAEKRNKKKYKVKYFLLTHDYTTENIEVGENSEMKIFGNTWYKPMAFSQEKNKSAQNNLNKQFYFEELSAHTNRIVLRSFAISNEFIIDSIIRANDSKIRSKPNLIIDVRDNSGGWSGVSNFFIPYFYTRQIRYEKTVYKSSDDLLDYYKSKLTDTTLPASIRKQTEELIRALALNKGKMVQFGLREIYKQDSSSFYPKRIGVIINGNCASAAEMFILVLKQSSKTIFFGENTKGAIDYGNVRSNQPLPCPNFRYSYPIVQREGAKRKPLDNIGIKPDVYLRAPESEWVRLVLNTLEQNDK